MRPAGDVRQALLRACSEMYTPERSPTLAELTARACVSRGAALHTVKNLIRNELLFIPRTRKVEYRNRPVAEYAPAEHAQRGVVSLSTLLAAWNR